MTETILSILNPALDFLSGLTKTLLSFWWVILPVVLIIIALELWKFHKQEEYKSNIDWTLLEVTVPKEVEKTPKAMEQVFAAMHTADTKIKFHEKWFEGKVEDWMSFELVGRSGKIHFMIRTPTKYRNLVESSIYAQYSEAVVKKIPEEEDYVNQFPNTLPSNGYDLWGTEFILDKDDAYPIRTYEYFEDKDEKRLDPIAAIMETMSNLKPSEAIWLQILLKPADDDWIKEGEKLAEKLWEGKTDDKSGPPEPFKTISKFLNPLGEFLANLSKALFIHPSWAEDDGSGDSSDKSNKLSPGKEKIVEAVEDKISKLGFDCALRFVYIDKEDEFTKSNVSSVLGSLSQFNTNNMNKFDKNKKAMKGNMLVFPEERRELQGKRKLYSNYITRDFPKETSVFNTEELATLYHFPITDVKTPRLQKTDFKKGGPPADLPTLDQSN